jgi:hypothetical protein
MSRPQGHSAARRIMSMKNSSDIIGNRSRDLPVCIAVPQPLRHRVPSDVRLNESEIIFLYVETDKTNALSCMLLYLHDGSNMFRQNAIFREELSSFLSYFNVNMVGGKLWTVWCRPMCQRVIQLKLSRTYQPQDPYILSEVAGRLTTFLLRGFVASFLDLNLQRRRYKNSKSHNLLFRAITKCSD